MIEVISQVRPGPPPAGLITKLYQADPQIGMRSALIAINVEPAFLIF